MFSSTFRNNKIHVQNQKASLKSAIDNKKYAFLSKTRRKRKSKVLIVNLSYKVTVNAKCQSNSIHIKY